MIRSCILQDLLVVILALFLFTPNSSCYKDDYCFGCKDDTTYSTTENIDNWRIGPKINLVQRPKIGVPASALSSFTATHKRRHVQARSDPDLVKAIVPPLPPSQAQSAGIFQDGNDFSYFAEVFLGPQKSMMYMLLDTGGSLSWVMGEDCHDPICLKRNTYGAQNSSTLELSNTKFSVSYGTGSCSGVLVHDTVSFAGLSFRMPFGAADTVSKDFAHFEMYGILGLSIGKSKTGGFISSLIESKSLKRNMFGMSLSRTRDGNNTGVINFGAPDSSRFTGDLKYYPLAGDGNEWVIQLTSAGFGETQIPLVQNALIDTGTSYLFAPKEVAKKMYAHIPGATSDNNGSTWQVPCDTKADMIFKFGSDTYKIPSNNWVGNPSAGNNCHTYIGGTDLNDNDWVIGDFFLKNYYVVFDIDKRAIGLADSKIPSPLSLSNPPRTLPPPNESSNALSEQSTATATAAATNSTSSRTSESSRRKVKLLSILAFAVSALIM